MINFLPVGSQLYLRYISMVYIHQYSVLQYVGGTVVVANILCHLETPDCRRVSHFMVAVHTYYVCTLRKIISLPW